LSAGVADGTIDCVCSDHTPVDEDAKHQPFSEAAPGATGLELLLPLMLRWGAMRKRPLAQTLARISCDPARILGVRSGRIEIGAPGDLLMFDPDASVRLTAEGLKSQGKNTPFLGYELPGLVHATSVAGRVVYERE
jgi:dihydroorotase